MTAVRIREATKSFHLHLQGGVTFTALSQLSLDVERGSCVALHGPSGAGKSTLLKMIYGSYRCDSGSILVEDVGGAIDVACATPREIMALRRRTLGYVSQFLRAIPRIGARDLITEEARVAGVEDEIARRRAETLLERLNVPARLWDVAPATFSGGEQQRVNIARGFVVERPVLLLDEPTASLDAANRAAVEDLVMERRRAGAAMLAIMHDVETRDRVADRIVEMRAPNGGGGLHV
ncbi:MAG: phosphonate C-P lyase system protein PhnL [Hyphomicrobiales bacterium]|nr:phosphonate C-P lyase system protein PhnL [Hyphomicrobiales bacterium]